MVDSRTAVSAMSKSVMFERRSSGVIFYFPYICKRVAKPFKMKKRNKQQPKSPFFVNLLDSDITGEQVKCCFWSIATTSFRFLVP